MGSPDLRPPEAEVRGSNPFGRAKISITVELMGNFQVKP